MDQRQLASVLFAVAGVFLVILRLPELVILAGLLTQTGPDAQGIVDPASQRYMPTVALVATILAILLGAGLVMARHWLADRLFSAGSGALEAQEVHAAALSVVGCYMAISGLAAMGRVGGLRLEAALEVVLGVALFFGARGLSALWSRARSAGVSGSAAEHAR